MKLKPCPFCGSEVEFLSETYPSDENLYEVYCRGCKFTFFLTEIKEETIAKWNRRLND